MQPRLDRASVDITDASLTVVYVVYGKMPEGSGDSWSLVLDVDGAERKSRFALSVLGGGEPVTFSYCGDTGKHHGGGSVLRNVGTSRIVRFSTRALPQVVSTWHARLETDGVAAGVITGEIKDGSPSRRCGRCGAGGASRRAPAQEGVAVMCDACWSEVQQATAGAEGEPDHVDAEEHLDEVDKVKRNFRAFLAEVSTRGVCNKCGAPVEWRKTSRGRLVPMEPYRFASLPGDVRWRIDSHGVAHKEPHKSYGGSVYMSHLDTCPNMVSTAPIGGPALRAYQYHQRRFQGRTC